MADPAATSYRLKTRTLRTHRAVAALDTSNPYYKSISPPKKTLPTSKTMRTATLKKASSVQSRVGQSPFARSKSSSVRFVR